MRRAQQFRQPPTGPGRPTLLGHELPHVCALDRRLLLARRACAAEPLELGVTGPPLVDVDPAVVEQVGRQGEVQAARSLSGLLDDGPAALQGGAPALGSDEQVSRDDDHSGFLSGPLRGPPVDARPVRGLRVVRRPRVR